MQFVKKTEVDKSAIEMSSEEGIRLLQTAPNLEKFTKLVDSKDRQNSLGSCGLASIATLLNALNYPAKDVVYGTFKYHTMNNIRNMEAIKQDVLDWAPEKNGLGLHQVRDVCIALGLNTTLKLCGEISHSEFIDDVINTTFDQKTYMLVNFYRPSVGQVGGGHITPVAAYHNSQNQVLLMEVVPHKFSSFWVHEATLFSAMKELDKRLNQSRGYLLVSYDNESNNL